MPQLPERSQTTVLETPDIAIAKTVGKLTSKDSIQQLGNLDSENDVQRLALLINMGEDTDLKVTWLKEYAETEIALTNSLRTKQGGIRSEHLVRITKQPDYMPQQEGLVTRIRNRVAGR